MGGLLELDRAGHATRRKLTHLLGHAEGAGLHCVEPNSVVLGADGVAVQGVAGAMAVAAGCSRAGWRGMPSAQLALVLASTS